MTYIGQSATTSAPTISIPTPILVARCALWQKLGGISAYCSRHWSGFCISVAQLPGATLMSCTALLSASRFFFLRFGNRILLSESFRNVIFSVPSGCAWKDSTLSQQHTRRIAGGSFHKGSKLTRCTGCVAYAFMCVWSAPCGWKIRANKRTDKRTRGFLP